MKSTNLIALICVTLIACNNKSKTQFDNLINSSDNPHFKKYQIFDDKNYLLTLRTFDTTSSYNIDHPTVILNLLRSDETKIDTLVNDSIFSRNPIGAVPEIKIDFIDFNFDGVKDILIPYGTDPRGNHGFHLYLVDNNRKQIQYMTGFKDIGNPKADSIYQIIQSFVLAGPPFCRFYKINFDKELIDIDHYLEFSDFDSIETKIQQQMKKITTTR